MSVLLYIAALAGLGASSLLLVDYTSAAPVFCGAGGGCDIVRESQFAQIFGLKTPFFGVVFFTFTLVLLLWPARRLLVAWTAAGALAALGFLYLQAFVLHAFCPFCGIADGASLLLFGLALASLRRGIATPRLGALVATGVVAAGVAFAPFLVARGREQPAPAAEIDPDPTATPPIIAAMQQPGVATIIEFVDFECRYCRRLHETMTAVLASYGDKVRLVRKQQPLTTIHPHALVAAHAACCAEEAGAGDRMADELFRAPPEELTAEGCEKLAARAGLDVEKYRACMTSERPAARVASDGKEAKEAGIAAEAPVFWIGGTRYRGAQPEEVIRAAIDRELARR